MARRRKPRNPQDLLTAAQLIANACPTARNRRKLHKARLAYATRVIGSTHTGRS